MKPQERDELLIRLDERTNNIWHIVEQMVEHQEQQNGFIQKSLLIGKANTTWITAFKWIIGLMIGGGAAGITKLQGWW